MHETAKKPPVIGERLVHKTFPAISRHTLALYCGASGDHNPMHVDIDFANNTLNLFRPHRCDGDVVYWGGSAVALPTTTMPAAVITGISAFRRT